KASERTWVRSAGLSAIGYSADRKLKAARAPFVGAARHPSVRRLAGRSSQGKEIRIIKRPVSRSVENESEDIVLNNSMATVAKRRNIPAAHPPTIRLNGLMNRGLRLRAAICSSSLDPRENLPSNVLTIPTTTMGPSHSIASRK